MRTAILAACLAIGLLSVPRGAAAPNILLITLDTTRADRMGFLGSARGLTPALDALAKRSVVFTRAFAQAPITTVSHATILSGTYPPFHQVDDFGAALPASVPYLPDLLRQRGYRTAAFVGSLVLDPRGGTAPGFDRGFEVYDAGFTLRRPGENRYRTIERRGDDVVARARKWLATQPAPFFLWVHLFDPHDPYDPPDDLKRRFSKEPYDAEIATADRDVGELLKGVPADTVIAVTADHGESLGDHGETTHGVFLYDAVLQVPLLVCFLGGQSAGARVDTRVRLVDLAPTLLEAAGATVPTTVQGESLRPLIGQPKAEDRPVYAESSYPRRAFGWSALVSWRADRFLYVRAPEPELYDVTTDPGASRNLASARGRLADGLESELAAFLTRSRHAAGDGSKTSGPPKVDRALAERLASLGYVSGAAGAPVVTGANPKDRIAIANMLHEAIVAVEDGAFQRAIPLLEKVTSDEPGIPIAQLHLGVARARQKQYKAAITPLKRAVELQSGDMRAHYELGVVLYETGELTTAAQHFAAVAAKMPDWADARYSLGSVYARIDRVNEALSELRVAVKLEPRHFRANLLLGRLLTLRGETALAVPYLRTAVEVQPTSEEAKRFLADALSKKER